MSTHDSSHDSSHNSQQSLSFDGEAFDGRSSKAVKVTVNISDNGVLSLCHTESRRPLLLCDESEVKVSSRLANSPRYLDFKDQWRVETLDNASVDHWLAQHRPHPLNNLVHRLESRLRMVVLSLLIVTGCAWLSVQYGIPAAAKGIAHALPADLLEHSSQQGLELLDSHLFKPSKLSSSRRDELQAYFADALGRDAADTIVVHFRDGGAMGANAFALPDGQLIFTDQMVALAQHEEELLAILGHEVGHVEHRHALRRIVQDSILLFAFTMLSGDLSGSAEMLTALPMLMLELAYSRDYELEADAYALSFLQDRNIDPKRFADLMRRLDAQQSNEQEEKIDTEGESSDWQRYFSTHPQGIERLRAFDDAGHN